MTEVFDLSSAAAAQRSLKRVRSLAPVDLTDDRVEMVVPEVVTLSDDESGDEEEHPRRRRRVDGGDGGGSGGGGGGGGGGAAGGGAGGGRAAVDLTAAAEQEAQTEKDKDAEKGKQDRGKEQKEKKAKDDPNSSFETCECGASFRKGWAWSHTCKPAAARRRAPPEAEAAPAAPKEAAPAAQPAPAARVAPAARAPPAARGEGAAASAVQVLGQAAASKTYRQHGLSRKTAFECPVCLCDTEPSEGYTLSCTHSFCGACIGRYVSDKVGEGLVGVSQLICPDTACKAALNPHDVHSILMSHTADGANLWQRFDEFRLRGAVEKAKAGRHCPGKGCGYMFEWEQDGNEFKCPRCKGSFCLKCSTGWHAGEDCASAAARRRAEAGTDGDEDLAKYAKKEGLKSCPSCSNLVARIDGCNALTCRCGIIFCWSCVKQLRTAGLPEKRYDAEGKEQPYCDCNEWGVNAHRNKPVQAAMGGAAAGQAADVARPAAAAAAAGGGAAAARERLAALQQQLEQRQLALQAMIQAQLAQARLAAQRR